MGDKIIEYFFIYPKIIEVTWVILLIREIFIILFS